MAKKKASKKKRPAPAKKKAKAPAKKPKRSAPKAAAPKKASWRADGFTSLTPHIICTNAGAAIDFYKNAFGAQERVRMPGPDGQKVMHAELKIGDAIIMLADEFPEMGDCGGRSPQSLGGTCATMHLYVPDVDSAFERAIKAGATVAMPVSDMFWGDRYGQITDPFGHRWSLATHKSNPSKQEMIDGAKAVMGGKH
jgi:PhnB protein